MNRRALVQFRATRARVRIVSIVVSTSTRSAGSCSGNINEALLSFFLAIFFYPRRENVRAFGRYHSERLSPFVKSFRLNYYSLFNVQLILRFFFATREIAFLAMGQTEFYEENTTILLARCCYLCEAYSLPLWRIIRMRFNENYTRNSTTWVIVGRKFG